MGEPHCQSSLRNQLRTTYLIFEAWKGGFHKLQWVNLTLILENILEYIIKKMFLKTYTGVFAKRQQGLMKILWQKYKAAPGNLPGGQKAWAGLSWSKVLVNKKVKWGVGADRMRWIRNWMIAHTQEHETSVPSKCSTNNLQPQVRSLKVFSRLKYKVFNASFILKWFDSSVLWLYILFNMLVNPVPNPKTGTATLPNVRKPFTIRVKQHLFQGVLRVRLPQRQLSTPLIIMWNSYILVFL